MRFPAPLPARWLASAAARLMLLSGVGYAATAYAVSRALTRPRRRAIRSDPSAFGLPFSPIQIVTEDALRLSGWVVEPPDPRGTIALFHGMRRTREQMLTRLRFLFDAGYRCVAVDHRAHGESGGSRISFGWYEARDVQAVEQWIDERFPAQPRYALGISMGAAALCFAGASCRWGGIVLEGVYADAAAAFRRRVSLLYPAWFRQLAPAIMWITQKRLRVKGAQLRPIDAVRVWHAARVLGLTGSRDALAPVHDGIEVTSGVPGRAEFRVIPGAGHNDMLEVGGAEYTAAVLRFFEADPA